MADAHRTPASNQAPDSQAYGNNAQRAIQQTTTHTPMSLLPPGGEPTVPGDVGPMEDRDGEISYFDRPTSDNTLQQHIHDLAALPPVTHDARTALARALLTLCSDEPAAFAVTEGQLAAEEAAFQPPVVDEHHSYMPPPLPAPVVEYYDPGDPEPVEVPDIPRAVRPHAGEWWYFPAAVLVAAAVDWRGQPFLIWRRPTADLLETTAPYRGAAYYRVPHEYEAPLRDNLPPSAYPPEATRMFDAPQSQAQLSVLAQTGQSSSSTTLEELAAGWADAAQGEGSIQQAWPREVLRQALPRAASQARDVIMGDQQDAETHGVTRTVHFEVKVEETEVDSLGL